MKAKMDRRVRQALEASGLPWSIEYGKGHLKIRLDGKLIGVMGASRSEGSQRRHLNTIAEIRRVTKEKTRADYNGHDDQQGHVPR